MFHSVVARWLGLDWTQRLTLFEAIWTLTVTHLAIRLIPFRQIAPHLGSPGEAPVSCRLSQKESWEARRVGWAVTATASCLPWDISCLAQSVAGKWMLQRRGFPSTLVLGADRIDNEEERIEAHAWLCCGNEIVIGEWRHECFKVLVAFNED